MLNAAIKVPPTPVQPLLTQAQRQEYFNNISQLLKERDAVLIAHYYVDADIQRLAEQTQGFIGDSLEMARFGAKHPATTLVVAGVRFMGETAKMLSPSKTVLLPRLDAECSLDLGCSPERFADFIASHPDRQVVVYANTSAKVKALSDWVVTSSIAIDVVEHLHAQKQKILWAPDRHLGRYVKEQTGADLISWQGECIVHDEFSARALSAYKQQYPDAAILVHPESPQSVIGLADVVGSTSQLLKATQTLSNPTFIVATELGIFYKMQQASPHKQFIQAPTNDRETACQSCGHCPWMKMNQLDALQHVLQTGDNAIELDSTIIKQAQIPLQRMVDFTSMRVSQS